MKKVVVDDALRTKLCNLTQPLDLCDNAGRALGCFLPYADREPQIGPEELQRRMQNKGTTYTTAAVLAHLETL